MLPHPNLYTLTNLTPTQQQSVNDVMAIGVTYAADKDHEYARLPLNERIPIIQKKLDGVASKVKPEARQALQSGMRAYISTLNATFTERLQAHTAPVAQATGIAKITLTPEVPAEVSDATLESVAVALNESDGAI